MLSLKAYVVTVGASAWMKPRGYSAGPATHNGQLTRMRAPVRLAYSAELAPPLNSELLNKMTGGDEGTWARDVGEKAIELRRPPHLVFQFNTGPNQALVLPIGGQTAAEVALRDRTFCLPMPVIPPEQRDDRLLDIARTDKRFRQAWVARTVQQCIAVWNSTDNQPTPPEGCTTMKDELARQARAAPLQELSSQASRLSNDLTETGTSFNHHPAESQVTCETCENSQTGERSGADRVLSSPPHEKSDEVRSILKSYWQAWCDHLAPVDHEHGCCPNCGRSRPESDQGCPMCDPDKFQVPTMGSRTHSDGNRACWR